MMQCNRVCGTSLRGSSAEISSLSIVADLQSATRVPDTRGGELCERLFSRAPGAESFSRLQSASTDGAEVWHIGASLKGLCKKMSAFSGLGIPALAVAGLVSKYS